VAFRKAERSRWHTNASSGFPTLVSPAKLRARLAAGKGELLAQQLAANRVFRENETTEDAPLPRHIIDLEDVTHGLGLDAADEQAVQRLILDTNAHSDQTTQTQRLGIARERFVTTLRAMPYIDSDTRMELTKRVIAYWRRNVQTDYGKPPTVRAMAVKSEPTLVIKAAQKLNGSEKRISMPQIVAQKLPTFLKELRGDGTKVKRATVDPKTLKPTQDKLDTAKVDKLKKLPDALKKPILVSQDGFILDGHHRWAANKALKRQQPVIQVQLDRDDLLEEARDFDGAEFRKADKIPGGLADKKKPSDFPKSKLEAGIKVEMEHTSDRGIATEIAMDHLTEDLDYYEKLETIEKAAQLGLDFTSEPKSGPPAGYAAVPNSKHGGYRKRVGGKWQYWYPEGKGPKRKAKKGKERTFVYGDLSSAVVKQWRDDFRVITKARKELQAEGKVIHDKQWNAHKKKVQELGGWQNAPPFQFEPPEDYTRRFYALKNATARTFGTNLRRWAAHHVAEGNQKSIARRRIIDAATKVGFSDGFPEAHYWEGKSLRTVPSLSEFTAGGADNRAEKAWKRTQRQVRELLKTADRFIQEMPYESTGRRKAYETIERDRVKYRVYGTGLEPGSGGDRFVNKVLARADKAHGKLKAMGLGKSVEGLTVHVHSITAGQLAGTNKTNTGLYNYDSDTLSLFPGAYDTGMRTHIHEIAHRVYFRQMTNHGRKQWDGYFESRGEEPDETITHYGETNSWELFAEAFAEYVMNGPKVVPPRMRDQLERALRSTGMALKKSEDNDPTLIVKAEGAARGGKYIKRVPYYVNGKRKFRYYYRESATARDVTVGETVRLGDRVAEVLGIDKDGKITIREGKRKRTVTAQQWSKLMAKHYGDRYFAWAEKRAAQTVNAVLRHVPKELLADLKGSDAERMAQLEKRVPEVYAKLRASFQRSGVSPFEAKRVLGTVLERKGWEPEARAAVIGNVLEHRNMPYRQTIRGAENLAGGGKVKAGHVQAAADILVPPDGKTVKAEVDELSTKAEAELAALSAALAKVHAGAKEGDAERTQAALEAALNSPAMARLALVAQAMPGLKDKAIEPTRDALAEVQSVVPRSQPTREGSSAVVYVAGENGAPRALKARYKLVEASEAVASHDPNSFKQRDGYPEGVQERAYHRDRDEQAKVMRNANKLNPAFLVNTNPDAVNGPPILDQNGVVLGGNSRTMSMQLAYEKHPDRAKELRAYMAEHAHEAGFTADDVRALKNPVLVRVVETTGPDDQKLLVRQMNESFTQGMDPRTMQVAMGRKLDDAAVKQLGDSMEADETLNAFLDSKRAEGFINALTRVGVIDQRNSNQYMVKGTKRLNEDGKQLVERVLVGRTVGDADLLSNTGSKMVGNIARSVPFMTQAKAYGATYDLGDDLKVALENYNDLSFRARQGHRAALNADMSDKEFKGLFSQVEMFGERNPILDNPRAMTLLEVLVRKNGPQKMSAVFRDYAALAAQHPEDQESMFGDKPSPEELLARAMKGETKKSMEPVLMVKGGPYIGPKGGKWADPKHTIAWKEGGSKSRSKEAISADIKRVELEEQHAENAEAKAAATKQLKGLWRELARSGAGYKPGKGNVRGRKPKANTAQKAKLEAKREKIATTEVTEGKTTFKTGEPVTFDYVRNTAPAPKAKAGDDRYQQKIEPAGRYISHVDKAHWGPEQPDQTRGSMTFNKPLVLHMNTGGPDAPLYDENSWKARLQQAYGGKKGKALSRALAKEGFDGIVTVETTKRGSYTSEIVDLRYLHSGDVEKSMEPKLIVKGRTLLTPNIQVGEARGAPRFDTPPIPDYQSIYYPPEGDKHAVRERDQAVNRRRADAERARGKWGFHGKVLSAKPTIKWELEREQSEPAFKQPQERATGKPLRVSPKLNARTREEKGKTTYASADAELEGEGKRKSKRKKKKKRVTLTARKR